jgi:hypothetical protein
VLQLWNRTGSNFDGLEAIYPKPRLSCNGGVQLRFPYLLKGLTIERSNQVWCSDITYIGLAGGFFLSLHVTTVQTMGSTSNLLLQPTS